MHLMGCLDTPTSGVYRLNGVEVSGMNENQLAAIRAQVTKPLVADIHFQYKLALKAIEAGFDKIRINPGNIGAEWKVREVTKAAKDKGVPIRIGVNSGSIRPREGLEVVPSEEIVRNPPTAVPTATPVPIPTPRPCPPQPSIMWTRGDTLKAIAEEFGITVEALIACHSAAKSASNAGGHLGAQRFAVSAFRHFLDFGVSRLEPLRHALPLHEQQQIVSPPRLAVRPRHVEPAERLHVHQRPRALPVEVQVPHMKLVIAMVQDEDSEAAVQALTERTYRGIPVSPGVAQGLVYVYAPSEPVVEKRTITDEEMAGEFSRLEQA
jgi:hypothetical protein